MCDSAGKLLVSNHNSEARLQQDIFRANQDILKETCAIQRGLSADISRAESSSTAQHCDIRQEISESKSDLQHAICDVSKDVLKSTSETQKNLCDIRLQVSEGNSRIERQAAENLAQVKLQACENACRLERQAADNYASLSKQSIKQFAKLQHHLSECCCEIKERISSQNQLTLDLIKTQENDRLKSELANARQEVLLAKLSCNVNGNSA